MPTMYIDAAEIRRQRPDLAKVLQTADISDKLRPTRGEVRVTWPEPDASIEPFTGQFPMSHVRHHQGVNGGRLQERVVQTWGPVYEYTVILPTLESALWLQTAGYKAKPDLFVAKPLSQPKTGGRVLSPAAAVLLERFNGLKPRTWSTVEAAVRAVFGDAKVQIAYDELFEGGFLKQTAKMQLLTPLGRAVGRQLRAVIPPSWEAAPSADELAIYAEKEAEAKATGVPLDAWYVKHIAQRRGLREWRESGHVTLDGLGALAGRGGGMEDERVEQSFRKQQRAQLVARIQAAAKYDSELTAKQLGARFGVSAEFIRDALKEHVPLMERLQKWGG